MNHAESRDEWDSEIRLIKPITTPKNFSDTNFLSTQLAKSRQTDTELKGLLKMKSLKQVNTPVVVFPANVRSNFIEELKEIGDVVPKTYVDKLRQNARTCCSYIRYVIAYIKYHVTYYCNAIIKDPIFEILTLVIICANCIILAIDDPTDDITPSWHKWTDLGFQIAYTVELAMKIFALGFLIPKGAFLKNLWNIVDLIVVVLGYSNYMGFDNMGGFDPRPLRVFRVFRPFNNVIKIEGMRAIVTVLTSSFSLLFYVGIIYFFYLSIFAVIGLQSWNGNFNVRCMNEETHEFNKEEFCGFKRCPRGYTCNYYHETLNYNIIDFNNFLSSLLIVFITSTDEGGSVIQKTLIEVNGYYVTVYFTLIVIVGPYFLRHFVLGIFQYNVALLYKESKQVVENKKLPIVESSNLRCKTLKIHSPFRKDLQLDSDQKTDFWMAEQKNSDVTVDGCTELKEIEEIKSLECEDEPEIPSSYGSFKLKERIQEQDIINFDTFDEQMSKPLTEYNKRQSSDISLDKKLRLKTINRQKSNIERNTQKSNTPNKKVSKKESKTVLERTIRYAKTFNRIEKQFFHRDGEKEIEKEKEKNNKIKLPEEDKLVLKSDIEIDNFSSKDVLPNKDLKLRTNDNYVPLVQPYKLKRIIVPTASTNINKSEKNNLEKKELVTRSILKTKKNKEHKRKRKSGLGKGKANKAYLLPTHNTHGASSHTSVDDSSSLGYQDDESDNDEHKQIDSGKEHHIAAIPEKLEKMKGEISYETKCTVQWSGQDVLPKKELDYANSATSHITEIRVWKKGWKGTYVKFHSFIKTFISSTPVFWFLVFCGLTNTSILAMTRYNQPTSETKVTKKISTVFTCVYFVEIALKLFSFGIVEFLSDPMNCINSVVAILNILEMTMWNTSSSSSYSRSFQAFSTLRIFKVMRMLRLLKTMHSIKLIVRVISEAIIVFFYIGILIVLFLFIYALFGMQLFGGKFNFPEGTPRQNFDSFFNAFISVFQVLNSQKWNKLLYSSIRASNSAIAVIYYTTWLIIGNYILISLFLAFMLNMFVEGEEDIYADDDSKATSVFGSLTETFDAPKRCVNWEPTAEIILTGLDKDKKNEEMKSDCNYSLYLFSKKNKFRSICWKVVKSKLFEGGVLVLIVLSTLILALDTYFLDSIDTTSTKVLSALNLFFVICFTIEAIFKIITYGFLLDRSTYLREAWNVTDLAVLAFSFIDLLSDSTNMKMFKALRILRIFRTLRYLSGNNYIKVLFNALIKSFEGLCNAFVLILVIFIMFSIVGVHLFSGKFQYCSIDKYVNSNREVCVDNGGMWLTYRENFDNVINGLIHLFGMTNQEDWASSMEQALDCTGVGTGPKKDAGWFYSIYYIVFIFIGPLFLMKLFVGIMFYNFKKAYKDELDSFKGITLTQDRLDWLEIQKFILTTKPDYNFWYANTKSKCRNVICKVIKNFYFELFVTIVIFLNLIELALVYDKSFDTYPTYILVFNVLFLAVYTVETVLKLIGLGLTYWYKLWHIFEVLSLLLHYIDIILSLTLDKEVWVIRNISQIMRVLRVLRIALRFKLLSKLRNLQMIIGIVQICLPPIINVFCLAAFMFFVYAVLGCYLFHDVPYGVGINEIYNFRNFGKAIVLVLALASGEDSNSIMFECAKVTDSCVAGMGCGEWYSYVYFISFRIVVNFVTLNLFVLIVLYFFDKYFIPGSQNISAFKADYDMFKEKWAGVKPKYKGNFVGTNKLLKFFKSLPIDYNFDFEDINMLSKQITTLKIMQ